MKTLLSSILVLGAAQTLLAYRPISDGRMQDLLQEFNYTPNVELLRTVTPTCKLQDIEYTTTYPQLDTPLKIQAKIVVPDVAGSPVIFMLPPLGGSNPLDVMMAETFCKNKMAAIIITSNLTGIDQAALVPVTDHDHTHRRVASAIKGGIIVARTFANIDTRKVGLFGASLGGILGSVAYEVIPEISAATFIVNGGDVPHILANSDQTPVVKLKNARKAEMGFTTDAQYEDYLNNNLTLDPLHFTKLIKPEATKLYLSRSDISVPSADQMAFYNAIGTPVETLFYNLPHAQTILAVLGLGTQKQKTADWFLQRFALPNPRTNEPDLHFMNY